MDKYTVRIPNRIFNQIKSIKSYIQDVLLNPSAALRSSQSILEGIKNLEYFPERGIDADLKVGRKISHLAKTYGILTSNIEYLIFYSISTGERIVSITHLLPSQSDYVNLFFNSGTE